MQEQIATCFSGGAAKEENTPATVRPLISTSVYATDDGEAVLTWSRAAFGLSLRVDLRLSLEAAGVEGDTLSFRLRPWLLWRRHGTQKFRSLQRNNELLAVDFAWDLRKARFPTGGGPQPTAGYFVSISAAGKMFLVVGDMESAAYKKAKKSMRSPWSGRPILITRREHLVFPGSGSTFRTRARIGGQEKEISLELGRCDEGGERISVGLDRETILQVDQLKWKFRGNEKVELMGGAAAIHISWDVYRWLFERNQNPPADAAAVASGLGHAVFVFQFEGEKFDEDEAAGLRKAGRRWGLRKAESSSSSSSSGKSSSILEWASGEEEELHVPESSTLLVSIWRS